MINFRTAKITPREIRKVQLAMTKQSLRETDFEKGGVIELATFKGNL
ncbi:hypothetical protein GCM10025777_59400 [Membranihabitans marinus]